MQKLQQQRLQQPKLQSLDSRATAEHVARRSPTRHRLGIPKHLACKVGEASRPGPIDAATASDLADMLEMVDDNISVIWDPGMTAGIARAQLAEYHALTDTEAVGGSRGSERNATYPFARRQRVPSMADSQEINLDTGRELERTATSPAHQRPTTLTRAITADNYAKENC